MQLLLGCGHSRAKKLWVQGDEGWRDLVTVDISPDVGADIVWDLWRGLPFADDSAEEIHLYDVLEHTQAQGDWRGFFFEFGEFWRVLKPSGLLFGICPRWDQKFAWGDPGHTRVIQPETLTLLSHEIYAQQLDGPPETRTNRTDYRHVWRGDFDLVFSQQDEVTWSFVLRAVKPSRAPR